MNSKSQAGFELLLAIITLVTVTTLISVIMLNYQKDVLMWGVDNTVRNNCDELVNKINQALKMDNMRIKYYNFYNLTIEANARLITSFYSEGVIICHSPTTQIVNNTGYFNFNLTEGEYYLTNNRGVIRVSSV